MSDYNNYNFTPGNKSNLKKFLQKEYLRHYYGYFNTTQTFQDINNGDQITEGTLCQCFPFRYNPVKQGYNDPSQTENARIASVLTGTLGGKITYGNVNIPVPINYMGGWEGQPGGTVKPLRNRF